MITKNSARCTKCDTEIESKFLHDFKWCPCGAIFVDGGREYFHRGWDVPESFEDTSEGTDDECDPRTIGKA